MGKYNNPQSPVRDKILKNVCVICLQGPIVESQQNLNKATFDYTCNHCNGNVTIEITDIALRTSMIERLVSDIDARHAIGMEVSRLSSGVYRIDEKTLYQYLKFYTGEACPVSGKWAFDEEGFTSIQINQGDDLPAINGEPVKWKYMVPA